MFNVLMSEIEDIIFQTGNISLPQIIVTIANVILLAVNVIIAIIKKIKKAKKDKQNQEGIPPTELFALNEKKKETEMDRLIKFKVVISKEKFENEYETVSSAEGTDLGAVLSNAVSDMPATEPDASTIKAVLSSTYIYAMAHCYTNSGNSKVLTGIDAIFGVFYYKLSITTETEEEVTTVVKKEETLL